MKNFNSTKPFPTPLAMMKPRVGTVRAWSRRYSIQSTIPYISEENTFRFPSEKLTEEENRAAIPKKPELNDANKIMKEIISPEYVADLYTKYDFNDVFVSSLAKNGTLAAGGKVIPTRDVEPHEVELLYTKFAVKWIEIFNKKTEPLNVVPTDKKFEFTHSVKQELLLSKFSDFEVVDIAGFYNSLKVFSNGSLEEQAQKKTDMKDITIFLLNHEFCSTEENFDKLLAYVSSIAQHFSADGIAQVVEEIISTLDKENPEFGSPKVKNFVKFVEQAVYPLFPRVNNELDPVDLDKFIQLASLALDSGLAIKLMKVLISHHKFAPTHKSFKIFLSSYEKELDFSLSVGEQKIKVLRELYPLKQILFSYELDNQLLDFIVDYTVETSADLHQFIRFVESQPNKLELLSQHVLQLLQALARAHQTSQESNLIKSVELSLLLRKLTVENTIELDSDAKNQATKMFELLGIPQTV